MINKSDTSYANVKRGTIRIIVPNNVIPNESEFKEIAADVWEKYRGNWQTGAVFIYVKDMPTNSLAYAVANFKYRKLEEFFINTQALEMHEYFKSKKKKNKQQSISPSSAVETDDLTIERKYGLSKKTPLMPKPDPKDKMEALILQRHFFIDI